MLGRYLGDTTTVSYSDAEGNSTWETVGDLTPVTSAPDDTETSANDAQTYPVFDPSAPASSPLSPLPQQASAPAASSAGISGWIILAGFLGFMLYGAEGKR